jgi:decaprenylphospho-beta-D-ribofuranose 2-oxidase
MGLTGVITELTLRLLPLASPNVLVDTERMGSLRDLMTTMRDSDDRYDYSVAWVDCVSRGRAGGRSILERANRPRTGERGAKGPRRPLARVPITAPSGLLNGWSVRAFNELWYRKARPGSAVEKNILSYLHPLDMLGDWNLMYGRRGFVQYQYVVPDGAEDAVADSVDRLASSGVPSFLAVLKRFGPANPGPLSFPLPGWTLALDLPVGPPRLPSLLDELDQLVIAAGGRVYLAKDARLDASTFTAMYPRAEEFRDVKNRVDPTGILTSDLARRVGLVGA